MAESRDGDKRLCSFLELTTAVTELKHATAATDLSFF